MTCARGDRPATRSSQLATMAARLWGLLVHRSLFSCTIPRGAQTYSTLKAVPHLTDLVWDMTKITES